MYYVYKYENTYYLVIDSYTYIPVHSIFFLGFPSYPALHSQAEMELLPVFLVFEFFGHPVHLSGEGKALKEPSGQAVWKNSFMILRTWQSRACIARIFARKIYLRSQLIPFPENPALQVQTYLPLTVPQEQTASL